MLAAVSRLTSGHMNGRISVRLDERSEVEVDSGHMLRLTSGALYVDTGSVPAAAG